MMHATELQAVGAKAYNGDKKARAEWFERLAPVAIEMGKHYNVLPSLILGKVATESGFMSGLYEEMSEKVYGIKLHRKALEYDNCLSVNAFDGNKHYLPEFPSPAWQKYRTTFSDYGPHWRDGKLVWVPGEPWKAYNSVEDCIGDWCANMRWQAQEYGHKAWGMTLEEQLICIETFTPEGLPAHESGMHYDWQDYILWFAEEFNLRKYDKEAIMPQVAMTQKNLDNHIVKAYRYSHDHCKYGPSGTTYPPGAAPDFLNDCVGLFFRCMYTMGRYPHSYTIDQVVDLCKENGMVYSTDENDVWRHHAVACYQDKNNKGTMHVNHVYYSLGGTGLDNIDKYDLGSLERIKAQQPFRGVPTNEWKEKRNFLCCMYLPPEKREDVPQFETDTETLGVTIARAGLYAGPGTAWRRIAVIEPDEEIILRGRVTNDKGHLWWAVRYKDKCGYIGGVAARGRSFKAFNAYVQGTDGTLALRVGAGGGCFQTADIPDGDKVRVDGLATAADGSAWYHIRWGKMRGYACAKYIKKVG